MIHVISMYWMNRDEARYFAIAADPFEIKSIVEFKGLDALGFIRMWN